MTGEEMIRQMEEEWQKKEEETEVSVDGHMYTVADLRRVFDRVCDPNDWKAHWGAWVPWQLVGLVRAAVNWYHGDTPRIVAKDGRGRLLMTGRGYQG